MAGVIDKQHITGHMMLAHRAALLFLPLLIQMAILGIAVTTVGILLRVFLPQQMLSDAALAQLLVHCTPIGQLEPGRRLRISLRVKTLRQFSIIEATNQRPGDALLLSGGSDFLDSTDADTQAIANLSDGQAGIEAQP